MDQQMQTNRPSTSTQIRNMYSEGYSCLNIRFYNTNLSFQWYQFTGKDQAGRAQYDSKTGQQTTVNVEGAYALYHVAKEILEGKVQETNVTVQCLSAQIILERKRAMNGEYETFLTISKNGVTIPFKFQSIVQQVREPNGQITTKQVDTGLGALMKTIEGYLTGINADRHLDKLTEEYIRHQESQQSMQNPGNVPKNNNKYRNNYNPNRNNYNGNKRPYNNQYNNNQSNNGWNPQSQNLSSYELPEN